LLEDVPNLKVIDEDGYKIRLVLFWQASVVVSVALISYFLSLSWSGVLFGGLGVVMSTWHVHRSVNQSVDNRGALLQAAGVRFFLFLLIMATGVYVLQLQPKMIILGMVCAYVAMYVGSFIIIFKKMKGDGLG